MIETGEIYNLAAAFNYLVEIDSGLLDVDQQEILSRMKEKILNCLAYNCLIFNGVFDNFIK
jgi:hypothetical protein